MNRFRQSQQNIAIRAVPFTNKNDLMLRKNIINGNNYVSHKNPTLNNHRQIPKSSYKNNQNYTLIDLFQMHEQNLIKLNLQNQLSIQILQKPSLKPRMLHPNRFKQNNLKFVFKQNQLNIPRSKSNKKHKNIPILNFSKDNQQEENHQLFVFDPKTYQNKPKSNKKEHVLSQTFRQYQRHSSRSNSRKRQQKIKSQIKIPIQKITDNKKSIDNKKTIDSQASYIINPKPTFSQIQHSQIAQAAIPAKYSFQQVNLPNTPKQIPLNQPLHTIQQVQQSIRSIQLPPTVDDSITLKINQHFQEIKHNMMKELMIKHSTHVDQQYMHSIVNEIQTAADQIMNKYKQKMVQVSLIKDQNTLQFSITQSQQLKQKHNQDLIHNQKQYYKPQKIYENQNHPFTYTKPQLKHTTPKYSSQTMQQLKLDICKSDQNAIQPRQVAQINIKQATKQIKLFENSFAQHKQITQNSQPHFQHSKDGSSISSINQQGSSLKQSFMKPNITDTLVAKRQSKNKDSIKSQLQNLNKYTFLKRDKPKAQIYQQRGQKIQLVQTDQKSQLPKIQIDQTTQRAKIQNYQVISQLPAYQVIFQIPKIETNKLTPQIPKIEAYQVTSQVPRIQTYQQSYQPKILKYQQNELDQKTYKIEQNNTDKGKSYTVKYDVKILNQMPQNNMKTTEVYRISPFKFQKKEDVINDLVKRQFVARQSQSFVYQPKNQTTK